MLSRDTLSPLRLTDANAIRKFHHDEELIISIQAVIDDESVDWHYEGVNQSDLYRAYQDRSDYVIYKVDDSSDTSTRTVIYEITAEELAKQIEEARKEIESCGKKSLVDSMMSSPDL